MDAELNNLKAALDAADEFQYASMIQVALSNEAEKESILTSNDLWGGAGSVADQAGLQSPNKEARARIEKALIQLGRQQLEIGVINQRTEFWVSAFEQIHAQSI